MPCKHAHAIGICTSEDFFNDGALTKTKLLHNITLQV